MEDSAYIIDTLFTLFAMTLIIFMVPGFAMLEAGLVRTKNASTVLTTNVMIYAVASMAFLLVGYSIAFGEFGSDNMSKWAVFMFQMAFVGKAINIMSGGVSERVRIMPLAIFTAIMGGLIYPLIVNVSWGSDFLTDTFLDLNMYDLAGSTVIHSTGGWALLAAILIVGPRRGRYRNGKIRVIPASNIPLVVLGALLLWIGWFGFNGGSVGSISTKENADLVALTIMNTNTAGPDLYDIYTPILIGAVGGALVVFAVPLFDKLRLDDPVGALSVHLVNGIWGTLAVGIFASNGDDITLWGQIKGIILVGIFAFAASYTVIYLINKFMPFRADDNDQQQGLDFSECGLESYPEFVRN